MPLAMSYQVSFIEKGVRLGHSMLKRLYIFEHSLTLRLLYGVILPLTFKGLIIAVFVGRIEMRVFGAAVVSDDWNVLMNPFVLRVSSHFIESSKPIQISFGKFGSSSVGVDVRRIDSKPIIFPFDDGT